MVTTINDKSVFLQWLYHLVLSDAVFSHATNSNVSLCNCSKSTKDGALLNNPIFIMIRVVVEFDVAVLYHLVVFCSCILKILINPERNGQKA
jgi:hypothetical protein